MVLVKSVGNGDERLPRRQRRAGHACRLNEYGIAVLLISEIADYLLPRHYFDCDASLILEDNEAIIKIIDAFGGKYYKRWRIYDLPLK